MLLLAPAIFVQLAPLGLTCQWTAIEGPGLTDELSVGPVLLEQKEVDPDAVTVAVHWARAVCVQAMIAVDKQRLNSFLNIRRIL